LTSHRSYEHLAKILAKKHGDFEHLTTTA